MNYAQAKQIAAEHAPDLIVDEEVKGQPHICVRASETGAPFSIHLPPSLPQEEDVSDEDAAAAVRKTFTDALDAASKHLGM